MPLKGESASFFSISIHFNIQAGFSLSLSSFLPSRRSPPPLLRLESRAGEVSTQEPKLSTSSESPRRRATVHKPRRRGAPGGWLAQHQRSATGTLGEQLGSRRPRKPQLSASASPKASGQRERTKRLRRAPGRGEQPLAMLLSSRGRASAHRAPNQPTLCTTSRQPALRLCARSFWAQNYPRHSSAKGSTRPPPAGADSVGTAATSWRPRKTRS